MSAVYITGCGTLSAAGMGLTRNWEALRQGIPRFTWDDTFGPLGRLDAVGEAALQNLQSEKRWRTYDRAALLGVLAATEAWRNGGSPGGEGLAVVFGSSRGATQTLEREHDKYLATGKAAASTSPMSTQGVFAAAVGRATGAAGLTLTVSSACSTSLNALGVAASLIATGGAEHALAGGAEASLTPFTLAQLSATSVLARHPSALFPARPMHPGRSGLVPGEGAACLLLSSRADRALARIEGFGAASEAATPTGISPAGGVLVKAIAQALAAAHLKPADVDLVVAHGAGTAKGDEAELAAYKQVFGATLPLITCHKWLAGHLLGAASAFSVALTLKHFATSTVPALPYYEEGMLVGRPGQLPKQGGVVLIAALGFGGNASALVLRQV